MDAYWLTTQQLLQPHNDPLVRRPRLTEALLKRPPFRFLHDVISEITRKTRFAEGLLTGEELKDKEARIDYLTKIINCVGITLNAHVPVRPIKILAGLEPEQTNIFLQMLAQAAMSDPHESLRAVRRCFAGDLMPAAGADSHGSEPDSPGHSVSSEKLRRAIYSPGSSVSKTKSPEPATLVDILSFQEQREHQKDLQAEECEGDETDRAPCGLQPTSIADVSPVEEKGPCQVERDDSKQDEIRRLRSGIQALCQAITPLGKSIDYLQEDAEAMAKEHQFWIKEQETYALKLEKEEKRTEELLQLEQCKLQELEDEVKLQEQRNHMVKAEILRNEDSVFALLIAASTSKSSNMPAD